MGNRGAMQRQLVVGVLAAALQSITANSCPDNFYGVGGMCIPCPASGTSSLGFNHDILSCKCPSGTAMVFGSEASTSTCQVSADCDGVLHPGSLLCWKIVPAQNFQTQWDSACEAWGGELASVHSEQDLAVASALAFGMVGRGTVEDCYPWQNHQAIAPWCSGVAIGAQGGAKDNDFWMDGSAWAWSPELFIPGYNNFFGPGYLAPGMCSELSWRGGNEEECVGTCMGIAPDYCNNSPKAVLCTRPSHEGKAALLSECEGCSFSRTDDGALGRSGSCPSCTHVVLRNSGISSVGQAAFEGMGQVVSLDLSNNRIAEISAQDFSALDNLQRLDLGGNKLLDTHDHANLFAAFAALPALRELRLGTLLSSWSTCPDNWYGNGISCSPCPHGTSSEAGYNRGWLGCRCPAGSALLFGGEAELSVCLPSSDCDGVLEPLSMKCWTAMRPGEYEVDYWSLDCDEYGTSSRIGCEGRARCELWHGTMASVHTERDLAVASGLAYAVLGSEQAAVQGMTQGAVIGGIGLPEGYVYWSDGSAWEARPALFADPAVGIGWHPTGMCSQLVWTGGSADECVGACMGIAGVLCPNALASLICSKPSAQGKAAVLSTAYQGCSFSRTLTRELRRSGVCAEHIDAITLTHVGIASLHPAVFAGMHNVTTLDLSNNYLRDLPVSALRELTVLADLDLSGNYLVLESASPYAPRLTSVTKLDLGYNRMWRIPDFGLEQFSSLQELVLAGNRLQEISPAALSGLNRTLKLLDLRHMGLTHILPGTLTVLERVETFLLQNNPLECLPLFPLSTTLAVVPSFVDELNMCLPAGCVGFWSDSLAGHLQGIRNIGGGAIALNSSSMALLRTSAMSVQSILSMVRSDVALQLDRLGLLSGAYADATRAEGVRERCWCQATHSCFDLPLHVAATLPRCAGGSLRTEEAAGQKELKCVCPTPLELRASGDLGGHECECPAALGRREEGGAALTCSYEGCGPTGCTAICVGGSIRTVTVFDEAEQAWGEGSEQCVCPGEWPPHLVNAQTWECPTCTDKIRNQDEDGVDCGGEHCPSCPTCSDGIQNRDETAADCGGVHCEPCKLNCSECAVEQASTYGAGVAAAAVDGLGYNGVLVDSTAGLQVCSHTGLHAQAWWRVDMGAAQHIASLKVWNRQDCCEERLSGFEVWVSDQPDLSTARACYRNAGCPLDHVTVAQCHDTGQYVWITVDNNYLTLCEVEIFLASCGDGVQNQDESAVDCGGAVCGACPSCGDGIQNQGETDVDCGGPHCAPCVSRLDCAHCAVQQISTQGQDQDCDDYTFDSSLTHWYRFEPADITFDSSGNGHTLTAFNMGESSFLSEHECKAGGCVLMDNSPNTRADSPTAQYLQIPRLELDQYGAHGMTVSTFYKVKVPGNCARVLDWGHRKFLLALTCAGESRDPVFWCETCGPEMAFDADGGAADGEWHHVAWVRYPNTHPTRAGFAEAYLDGVMLGESEWVFPPQFSFWDDVYIGKSSFEWDITGALAFDDFRVYSSALSPEQVAMLSNHSCQQFPPPPLFPLPAPQSSAAFDGIGKDGFFASGGCTETNQHQLSWWMADIGSSRSVAYVLLWNRQDCCSDALGNFRILLGEEADMSRAQECYRNNETAPAALTHAACGARGRYLWITVADRPLTLCEVEIFAEEETCWDGIRNQDETDVDCGGANCMACPTCWDGIQNQDETGVDCGGAHCSACRLQWQHCHAASQISTTHGAAMLAGDGIGKGGDFASGGCTHTDVHQSPWWMLDMGAPQGLSHLKVWNRDDSTAYRLGGFRVLVGDFPDIACARQCYRNEEEVPELVTVAPCHERGQYLWISVEHQGPGDVLTLCEVEVYLGSCTDNVQNQDEEGVDCGGGCARSCGGGHSCVGQRDLRPWLTHSYQFESGDVLHDSSGNGHDLIGHNLNSLSLQNQAACKHGECILLANDAGTLSGDLGAQYVQLPRLELAHYRETGISVSSWFKVRHLGNCARILDFGFQKLFISLRCHGAQFNPQWWCRSCGGVSPATIYADMNIQDGEDLWRHVGLVLHPDSHPTKPGFAAAYLDGELVGEADWSFPAESYMDNVNIGKSSWWSDSAGSLYFDDLRIYSTALSRPEIQMVANRSWSSGWRLVFRQTMPFLFDNIDDFLELHPEDPTEDNFSIMGTLECFRGAEGKLLFKLLWPETGEHFACVCLRLTVQGWQYQQWRQTSNPVQAACSGVDGFESIHQASASNYWGGLEWNLSPGRKAWLDGSVDHHWWFYAVGALQSWSHGGAHGFPAYDSAVQRVELYAWVDDASTASSQPPFPSLRDAQARTKPQDLGQSGAESPPVAARDSTQVTATASVGVALVALVALVGAIAAWKRASGGGRPRAVQLSRLNRSESTDALKSDLVFRCAPTRSQPSTTSGSKASILA